MSDRDSTWVAYLYFLGVGLLLASVYLLRVDRLIAVSAAVTVLSCLALFGAFLLRVAG